MSKTSIESKYKECYTKKCGSDSSCKMAAQFGSMGGLYGGGGAGGGCGE